MIARPGGGSEGGEGMKYTIGKSQKYKTVNDLIDADVLTGGDEITFEPGHCEGTMPSRPAAGVVGSCEGCQYLRGRHCLLSANHCTRRALDHYGANKEG